MRVVERVRDLDRDRDGLRDRQPGLRHEPVPERFALDERHDGVQQGSRFPGIQQRHDVRVLQLCGDVDLAEEALGPDSGGDVGVEHLDRDRPLVASIVREVHVRHASAAELAVDDVAFTENLLDLIEESAHAGR